QALSAKVANDISSYSLPEKRREYLPRLHGRVEQTASYRREIHEEYADGRRGDFEVNEDGSVAFAVPFPDGPGVYTVVVWVHARGSHEPVAASNVSVRVIAGAALSGTK